MSSAVESFGPASAAAAHPYAHHNPFAIAAAAAAAGSAAAAAAAVIPSHHHHHLPHLHHHHQTSIKTEPGLEHQYISSIYNNISVSAANSHIPHSTLLGNGNSGSSDLFLPPPRPPTTLSSSSSGTNLLPNPLALSSKTCNSPQEQPNSPRNRSPRSKATNFQGLEGICSSNNMSSAEFARPHPKQPRYNNNNNNNNNNANTTNNNNNSHPNNNNNSYTSNAIPLHLRSAKSTNHSKGYNNSLNNNVLASDKNSSNSSSKISSNNNNSNHVSKSITSSSVALPRAKYSNEQYGPVNLVTTNNINLMNHNNNNNNSHCRTPPSSIPTDVSQVSPSSSEGSDCSRKSSSEMYQQQKIPFTAQSLAVTSNAAVAAAACAAAYQYNYPHMYASRALYGTSALFPGHHALVHHNTIRPCPTYLGGQHDTFTPYLQAAGVYQSSVPTNVAPPPPPPPGAGLLRTTNPQVLLNNTNNNVGIGSVMVTKPSSPLGRNSSYPPSCHSKDINNMNGTYLNGKVNTSPAAPESVTGFKVPSGKEGSLKHRILTRPAPSDRDATKRKSPITAAVVRSNSNSSTSNFTKGAFIELANGALRRVEDMRTEDFIQSAEKSAFHQLAESTVVKISSTQSNVIITFSYDKNRSKADVEVSQEHPFFVYGQGWASCNPDLTLKSFGLKCQRLQVGDICISLISKDPPQQHQDKQQHHQNQISASCNNNNNQQAPSKNFDKSEPISLPQNLSRKLPPTTVNPAPENTIPSPSLTNIVSNVTHRLTSMGAPTYIPNSLTHNPYEEAAAYENTISRHHEFYQPPLHLHHPYHRLLGHEVVASRIPLQPPPSLPPPPQSHSAPVQKSRPPSNQSSYYPEPHHRSSPPCNAAQNSCGNETQQQPVDASLSRKRRWSAPESICDDDENECQPPTAPRLSSNVNAYNS